MMNRFFCLSVAFSIFYLINQPEYVLSSNSGSGGASKLNLGVWIPPMTLRLPKFNMPKIKISATIKPRKNQPPMKIHLPEMSLNAKALGDDDNYGGGNSYSSGGNSYSSGGNSYSSGGNSYSSGNSYSGSSYGGDSGGNSYSSGPSYGDTSYSTGGNTYNDYTGSNSYGGSAGGGYSYRASASNQNNQPNYQQPQSNNNNDYQSSQQPNYNQNNNYNNDYRNHRYSSQIQDQRNTYYVDNSSQQQATPVRYENVAYGASNSVQSNYRNPNESRSNQRSSSSNGSIVAPLSNYITKREKIQRSTYGVNSGYTITNSADYARN